MRLNSLDKRSRAFALCVVELYRLLKKKRCLTIAQQVFRSGTSIGANIAEGRFAQSKKDLISKHGIALKEASETLYWLDVLIGSGIVPAEKRFVSMRRVCACIILDLEKSICEAKALVIAGEKRENGRKKHRKRRNLPKKEEKQKKLKINLLGWLRKWGHGRI